MSLRRSIQFLTSLPAAFFLLAALVSSTFTDTGGRSVQEMRSPMSCVMGRSAVADI